MPSNLDLVQPTLAAQGISRIAFLRHANTLPTPINGTDFDRPLSPLGKQQAQEAGTTFARDLQPYFTKMYVSPSPRTIETAQIVLDHIPPPPPPSPKMEMDTSLYELYDMSAQPGSGRLFEKHGYAPLKEYLNDTTNEQDCTDARVGFGMYSHSCINALMNALAATTPPAPPTTTTDGTGNGSGGGTTLWVVGHAMYTPSIVLGLATILDFDDTSKDLILSTNTKEAEGYLLDIANKEVSLLQRPSSTSVA